MTIVNRFPCISRTILAHVHLTTNFENNVKNMGSFWLPRGKKMKQTEKRKRRLETKMSLSR